MKKLLIISGIVIVTGVIVFGFIVPPPDGFFRGADTSFEDSEKVSKTETGYKITFDEYSEVELSDTKPEVILRKWGDETFIKISPDVSFGGVFGADKKVKPKQENGKLKFEDTDKEIHLYPLEKTEELPERFEYEVILKSKPATNVITLNIETKGLDFFYQPELTQEEKDNGDFRPENIIGSYAVYHKTKKNHILGQTNYKTGKAFHIYRPKIIDADGKEVWGNLNIENGILSVEIPQNFLDEAVYPIRHAAGLTFGYTTQGGSSNRVDDGDRIAAGRYQITEDGLATKITAWFLVAGGDSGDAKFAIYNSDATSFIKGTSDVDISGDGSKELEANLTTAQLLIANNFYYLAAMSSGTTIRIYRDATGTSIDYYNAGLNYGNWPTNISGGSANTYKFSIYCTYVLPPLIVTTQAVTDIAGIATATGNGNIIDLGDDANADKRGFVYDTTSRGDPGDTAPGDSDYTSYVEDTGSYATGSFTKTLTGLTNGLTYYVRAYAHGDTEGYAYGDEVSFINILVFSTAGAHEWTVPVGVTSANISCWGGGGGGHDDYLAGGGGGGGGAFVSSTIEVTPEATYDIYVGAGGTENSSGEDSTFDTDVVVADAGVGANTINGAAGGNTDDSTGDIEYAGGTGGTGHTTGDVGGGGGGAGGPDGAGQNGNNGVDPTGGDGGDGDAGAGGAGGAGGVNGNGGAGGDSVLGGGGGGGGDNGAAGGNGGTYGGGAGGGETCNNGTECVGATGACVITWEAEAPPSADEDPPIIIITD